MLNKSIKWHPPVAADGRVFALKQVKLAGMKRVDREEAVDEVRVHFCCAWLRCYFPWVAPGRALCDTIECVMLPP